MRRRKSHNTLVEEHTKWIRSEGTKKRTMKRWTSRILMLPSSRSFATSLIKMLLRRANARKRTRTWPSTRCYEEFQQEAAARRMKIECVALQ
jgi:hypothetical protein